MKELGVEVPPWRLVRHIAVTRDSSGQLNAFAVDEDGVSIDAVSTVKVDGDNVVCVFYGDYNEPPLRISGERVTHGHSIVFTGSYDPFSPASDWIVHVDEAIKVGSLQVAPKRPENLVLPWLSGNVNAKPITLDAEQWHSVLPIPGCDHVDAVIQATSTHRVELDVRAPCSGTLSDGTACGNLGENMQCLSCGVVRCGRHVHGHMMNHYADTTHPLICGYVDSTFWCYECDSYIAPRNPKLEAWRVALSLSKGE